MTERTVHTQQELDQAIADGVEWIDIRSEPGVWITVSASDSATVSASGSATVSAYDSATVSAYDSATVRAYDSATVRAYDSATVRASGSATVSAYDSATVSAYDSATVRAYDSATVRASDSATVSAYGSATVRAYGSATVSAGSHVAVHLHSGRARVQGGVLIDHTAVDQHDPATWCSYQGVEVEGGVATVYKAVRDDYRSEHGTLYAIGATVTCPDWRADNECGGGLHFSPTPGQAVSYDGSATRYLACRVPVADLRPIIGFGAAKCKAPGAEVVAEVDVAMRPIAAQAVSA